VQAELEAATTKPSTLCRAGSAVVLWNWYVGVSVTST
jgi:hypothetical protein